MSVKPPRSWGERENLTLSDAELARCEPIAAEGGKTLRAFCPFHGSDRQRSLRVNVETGSSSASRATLGATWRPLASGAGSLPGEYLHGM